jgi:transcriptional regulator with XRE-family HTH domain
MGKKQATFTFKVKDLARERGWTVEDLAQRSGVRFSTVRNLYQSVVKDPSYSTLYLVAEAFGVEVKDLISEVTVVDEEKNVTPREGRAQPIAV